MQTNHFTDIPTDWLRAPLQGLSRVGYPIFDNPEDGAVAVRGTSLVVRSLKLAPPQGPQFTGLYTRSDHPEQTIVRFEREIRETAYHRMFKEDFEPSFFDDSDMHAPYHLHVVYDQETGVPIASARSFSFRADLIREIGGSGGRMFKMNAFTHQNEQVEPASVLCPGEKKNYMVDRLSQIIDGHTYEGIPKQVVFGLLYRAIFTTYREFNYVFALARVDASPILLAKYLPLGLQIIGLTNFRVGETDRQHWVLAGDVARIRQELALNCQLLLSIYH